MYVFVWQREQEEAAEVYKEFVESFEESEKGLNRAWVKGGIVNPEKGKDDASFRGFSTDELGLRS